MWGDSEERAALQIAAHDLPAPATIRPRGSWQVGESPQLPHDNDFVLDERGEITLDPIADLAGV
jgi:hypothetical protein